MSNSKKHAKHLLNLYLETNKNKNDLIRDEAITKKAFLDFVGDEVGTTSVEFGDKTRTFTHGLITTSEEYISPKELHEHMVSLGLEDDFWKTIKVVKRELVDVLSQRSIASVTTIIETTKLGLKELR